MIASLPPEVTSNLPVGRLAPNGAWLVLPETDDTRDGIATVNSWLRAEDWYPETLQDVIWFGDDGVGNFFGWRPQQECAILWNPEDGDTPWREGAVIALWEFVLNGYKDTP
jgi:hypothetical protein